MSVVTHQMNSDPHIAGYRGPAVVSRSLGTWNDGPVMSAWILQLVVERNERHTAEEDRDLMAAAGQLPGCLGNAVGIVRLR